MRGNPRSARLTVAGRKAKRDSVLLIDPNAVAAPLVAWSASSRLPGTCARSLSVRATLGSPASAGRRARSRSGSAAPPSSPSR